MIIGLSGKAKAGKDLLFSFAQPEGWIKASFAEELKKRVRRDFNLTEAHTDGPLKDTILESLEWRSPRELMIDYGMLFRKYNSNYWVDYVLANLDTSKNYIFTDVRFVNEAEAIRNHGGFLVRLERHSSRDGDVSEGTKQSESETALDRYAKWDFHLAAELNETPSQLASFWEVIKAVINVKL